MALRLVLDFDDDAAELIKRYTAMKNAAGYKAFVHEAVASRIRMLESKARQREKKTSGR